MRRFKSIKPLAVCCILIFLLTANASASFSDTEGHWAEAIINKWSQNYGLLGGYSDGTFHPDEYITRGAFAGIMNRFMHYPNRSDPSVFPDIEGNYWADAILRLHSAGVYRGNGGYAFATATITHQQAVTMISRAFQITTDYPVPHYLDEEFIEPYARGAVSQMTDLGYLKNVAWDTFRPDDPITRAEIIQIFSNIVEDLVQSADPWWYRCNGNLMINSQGGATLTGAVINGDLFIAPGVAGPVILQDTQISGTVYNFSPITVEYRWTPSPTPTREPTPTPGPTSVPEPTSDPTVPTPTPTSAFIGPVLTPTVFIGPPVMTLTPQAGPTLPAATSTPIPTAAPTFAPTDTPAPTNTPSPTATPAPTDTPAPTAPPTATPTNTPVPAQTVTPAGFVDPEIPKRPTVTLTPTPTPVSVIYGPMPAHSPTPTVTPIEDIPSPDEHPYDENYYEEVTPTPTPYSGPTPYVYPYNPYGRLQPSDIYTPSYTEGSFSYEGRRIPIYPGVPERAVSASDFTWRGSRIYYTGNRFGTEFGVDVSAHNNRNRSSRRIDWNAAKNDGVQFAFVRVGARGYSTGGMIEDEYYGQNIQGALDAGIQTGVYFFAQAITIEEALEEAEFVLQRIAGYNINGPVCYDWEMNNSSYRVYGVSAEMATACAIAFCERVAAAGYTPMIYESRYVGYVKYDQGAITRFLTWYPQYPSVGSSSAFPNFRYQVDMWQFSESCNVSGIGSVDANIWFKYRYW